LSLSRRRASSFDFHKHALKSCPPSDFYDINPWLTVVNEMNLLCKGKTSK